MTTSKRYKFLIELDDEELTLFILSLRCFEKSPDNRGRLEAGLYAMQFESLLKGK